MVSVKDMFANADDASERTASFEKYKAALTKGYATHVPGHMETGDTGSQVFRKAAAAPESSASTFQKAIASGDLQKSGVSAEVISSLQEQLARVDLAKTSPTSDWTIGNPTQLYPYDLEAGAKILAPVLTPLRNRIPRSKGQGNAHEFRVINGFTGTGTGGLGLINPGISESTSNTFGPGSLGLARGPKMQISGYKTTVPYLSFSMSTDVSYQQQFAGVGFDDTRQLASNGLLWSSMVAEEHMLLGSRGTASGFAGALAGPTFTLALRAKGVANAAGYTSGTGEVGVNTATVSTLQVAVTTVTHWGESVPTVNSIASVIVGDVVDIALTDVQGALGYRVYVGTSAATGAGSGVQAGSTVYTGLFPASVSGPSAGPGIVSVQSGTKGGMLTINFNGAGTSGVPNVGLNPVTTDSTASVNNYDGILTAVTGSGAGYVQRLNNTFSGVDGANVGNTFSNAFSAMWTANKASPDEILGSGADCKQVSDQLKTQSTSTYEIILNQDDASGATVGAIVSAVWNPIARKKVVLTCHPWLDQGTMPILTWDLNLPNSNIASTFEVINTQDYLGIQWPQIQFLFEESSYWQGTFVSYASAYSGCIQGILPA